MFSALAVVTSWLNRPTLVIYIRIRTHSESHDVDIRDSEIQALCFITVNISVTLADNPSLVICCLVQDDSRVFEVEASVDQDVADLQKLV